MSDPSDDPAAGRGSPPTLARYYGTRLAAHGDTAAGAGWPNEADRATRFAVMADLAGPALPGARILDVACGTGAFLAWLEDAGRAPGAYAGIDIDAAAIARAEAKWPPGARPDVRFAARDLLGDTAPVLPEPVDFVMVNGLFTVRDSLEAETMWSFMAAMLDRLWPVAARGLAFNVMSDVVDWRRDDLFHVPMDLLARHLFPLAGRRVVFRNDYDLYEYTAYVFRKPAAERQRGLG